MQKWLPFSCPKPTDKRTHANNSWEIFHLLRRERKNIFHCPNHSEFIYGTTFWLAFLNEIHLIPTEKFNTLFDSWTKFRNAKIHNLFFDSFSALAVPFALALFHILPDWGTRERIEIPQISFWREMRMEEKMGMREKKRKIVYVVAIWTTTTGWKLILIEILRQVPTINARVTQYIFRYRSTSHWIFCMKMGKKTTFWNN